MDFFDFETAIFYSDFIIFCYMMLNVNILIRINHPFSKIFETMSIIGLHLGMKIAVAKRHLSAYYVFKDPSGRA